MQLNNDEKYYFFFDLDGTLYFDDELSQENYDALMKLKKNGHEIFLATGRTKAFVPEKIKNIPWDGLFLGGTYIEYKDNVLCEKVLDEETILKGLNLIKYKNKGANFEGINSYMNITNEDILSEENTANRIDSFDFKSAKISKITFHYSLSKEDMDKFPEFDFIVYSYKTECVTKGCNKGNLINQFSNLKGIDKKHIIVFGDSENDLSMFNLFEGVAISPSSEEIKKAAFMITDEKKNGVAQALKTLKLI